VLVTVIAVHDAPVVRFRCAVGAAVGRWAGSAPPRAGDHDVELDVPATVRLLPGDPGPDRVADVPGLPGAVALAGRVEHVGEGPDTVVVLRVGGGLLLVEAEEPVPRVGDRVRLTVAELRLCPTGV